MKAIGWLVLASAVSVSGALAAHGGAPPDAGAPAAAHSSGGAPVAPPARLRTAMAHLREEVQPGRDGALAIANGAYRATFSTADGVVYTPRHGRALESRLTWRYRARTIATATTTRPLDAVAPVVSATGDHVVDFVRPGLIERYEGERAGVEQIFILPERPAGGGDIRITGDVTFDGAIREANGGLEFDAGHGLPVFRYAKPVAFDARQTPVPVRVELSGGTLSLVIDGAGLERVQWPVTIDPLFGVTSVETTPAIFGGDITYNPRRGEFLVVYGAWDTELAPVVRARRYRDYGDAAGAASTIATGNSGFFHQAKVAYDMAADRYLAVWMEQAGAFRVKGMLLDSLGNPVGSVLSFTSPSGSECAANPDVSARNLRDHLAADTAFLVVWTDGCTPDAYTGVHRQRVTGTGVAVGTATLSQADAWYTAVAFDPHTDRFIVAYANDQFVRVRTVSAAGGQHGGEVVLSTYGASSVSLDYDVASRRALVVWADGEPASLWGRFLESGATPVPIGGNFLVRQAGSGGASAAVAAEVGTFAVHQEVHTSSDADLVEVQRYRADGLSLGTTLLEVAPIYFASGGIAFGFHGYTPSTYTRGVPPDPHDQMLALVDRWFARYVHGGNAGDFDGDTRSDLFCYRPASGQFHVRTTSGESTYWFTDHGLPIRSGVPALMDYDGDGLTDLTLWVPATGTWRIRKSSDQMGVAPELGKPGDIPVPGDYHGLGEDQIAVFRPSTATWIVRTTRLPQVTVTFGQLGDLPVPADWNGDGDIELGVWRPSTGVWYAAELDGTPVPIPSTPWGQAGDIPLAGNFVGTATADQVVYRRQLGVIFRRDGASGAVQTITVSGAGLPVPLDWDGNGRVEPVLFDASSGGWRIDANTWVSFGAIGDIPAGAR